MSEIQQTDTDEVVHLELDQILEQMTPQQRLIYNELQTIKIMLEKNLSEKEPDSSALALPIVHGDEVGGDKVEGDKVEGNKTTFKGPVTGKIHTGSGDINI